MENLIKARKQCYVCWKYLDGKEVYPYRGKIYCKEHYKKRYSLEVSNIITYLRNYERKVLNKLNAEKETIYNTIGLGETPKKKSKKDNYNLCKCRKKKWKSSKICKECVKKGKNQGVGAVIRRNRRN